MKEAVQYTLAVASGQVHRQAFAAKLLAECLDQCAQVGTVEIDLVDHQQSGQSAFARVFHQLAGAMLDTVDGIDHHCHGFHGSQCG